MCQIHARSCGSMAVLRVEYKPCFIDVHKVVKARVYLFKPINQRSWRYLVLIANI